MRKIRNGGRVLKKEGLWQEQNTARFLNLVKLSTSHGLQYVHFEKHTVCKEYLTSVAFPQFKEMLKTARSLCEFSL